MALSEFEFVNVGHRRDVGTLEVVAPAVAGHGLRLSCNEGHGVVEGGEGSSVLSVAELHRRRCEQVRAGRRDLREHDGILSLHLGTSARRAHAATWLR